MSTLDFENPPGRRYVTDPEYQAHIVDNARPVYQPVTQPTTGSPYKNPETGKPYKEEQS